MCLGVPGKVVKWLVRETPFASAEVEFDGVRRACNLACVPDAVEGDYVIVHAGIAISRLDEEQAQRLLAELRAAGEMENETFGSAGDVASPGNASG